MTKLNYEPPPKALISLRAMKIVAPIQAGAAVVLAASFFGMRWFDVELLAAAFAWSILVLAGLAPLSVLVLLADYVWERRSRALVGWICVETAVIAGLFVFSYFLARAAIGYR